MNSNSSSIQIYAKQINMISTKHNNLADFTRWGTQSFMAEAERAFPFSLLHHHSCPHVTRTPFGHMARVLKRPQQNKPLPQKMFPDFLTLIFYLGIWLVWFNMFHMSPSNFKNDHTHLNHCFNYIEETELIKICNFMHLISGS